MYRLICNHMYSGWKEMSSNTFIGLRMPLGTQKTALEINLEQLLFYIAETESFIYSFSLFLLIFFFLII